MLKIIASLKSVGQADTDRWMAQTEQIRKPDLAAIPTYSEISPPSGRAVSIGRRRFGWLDDPGKINMLIGRDEVPQPIVRYKCIR